MFLASKDVAEILHKASTSQRELDERREHLSLMAQHQYGVTAPVAHTAQSLIHSAQIDRAATINVMKSLLIGDLRLNVNQLWQSQESQCRLCDLAEDCLTSNELINNLEAYLRDRNLDKRQYCLDQGSQGNWVCIRTNRSEIAPATCLILQKYVSSCFFELTQKIMLYSLHPELRRLSPRLRPLHPSLLSATVNEEGTEINLVIDIPAAANHNEAFKIEAYGYRIHPSSSSASHEQQEEVHIFSESSHSSSSSSSSMIRQQKQWSCSPMTSPSTRNHLLGLKIPIINATGKKRGGLVAAGEGGEGGLAAAGEGGEGLAAGGGGEGGGVQANDGRPSYALTIHLSIQC